MPQDGAQLSPALSEQVAAFLVRYRRFVLAGVILLSVATRIIYVAQTIESPIPRLHHWDQTDMSFFHAWAVGIAGGDILSRSHRPPLHGWHRAIAEDHFAAHPQERAESGEANAEGDDARLLWDRWVGGGRFYQEPLYPYLMGLTYRILGPDARWVLGWQLLLGVFTTLLISLVAWRAFGPIAGTVAGVGAALYAPTLYLEQVLVRDSLIVFTSAALLLLMDTTFRRNAWGWSLVGGIALGLSILLKTVFALFAVGCLVLGVVEAYRVGRGWQRPGLLATGILLILTGAMARNVAVGVAPLDLYSAGPPFLVVGSSYEEGADPYTLRLERAAAVLGDTRGAPLATLRRVIAGYPNPGSLVGGCAHRLAANLQKYEVPDNTNFEYFRLHAAVLRWLPGTFLTLGPAALVGLLVVVATGRIRRARFLLLMLLTHLLVLAVVFVKDRYRLPLVPVLMPLAGVAVAALVDGLTRRRWIPVVGGLMVWLGLSAWMSRPMPDPWPRIRTADVVSGYTVYYLPEARGAADAGDFVKARRIWEHSLTRLPREVHRLSASQRARIPQEAELARFLSGVYGIHAEVLLGAGEASAGEEARRRSRELSVAAEGWEGEWPTDSGRP